MAIGSRRTTPTALVAAAVVSEAIAAPTSTPWFQERASYTSGAVSRRRPPNTIAEIGIRNVKPHRPIESEIVNSIEARKTYYISTVHMNGHGVKEDWFETAVFLSNEEGEVECWSPVWNKGTETLEEAKEARRKVFIMAQSGMFDKINPWEI